MLKNIKKIVLMFSLILLTSCSNKTEVTYDYNYSNGILKAEINNDYLNIENAKDSSVINIYPNEKDNKSFISIVGVEKKYNLEESKALITSYKDNLNETYQTSLKNEITEENGELRAEYSLLNNENEIFQVKTKLLTDDNNTYMIIMFADDRNVIELKDSFNRLYDSLTTK